MSFFGKNIRKIRSIQKISQSEFAELFELSRASVGSYEEGRAEPKIELINKVANHFSITLDELINKELTVNELYHFDVGSEPTFKPIDRPAFNILQIPLLDSIKELNNKPLTKEQRSIELPLSINTKNAKAIIIHPNEIKSLPVNLKQNDLIIIGTNSIPPNEKQYFLIKIKGAIYISKLKTLAGYNILIKQCSDSITIVNIKDIDYYYPIISFMGDLPDESHSDKINRLEEQLLLLIERTLQ